MKSKIQNPQSPGRTSPGKPKIQNLLLSLFLFLLALAPRAYDLPRFVTADEAKWVYRSAQFWAAFLQGDFAGTTVNLTPAVTTTWLGGLGLVIYYRLHQATLGLPLLDWLRSLPEFRADLDVLIAARWPLLLGSALAVVAIYGLARRLLNPPVAFIGAVLIALDPHTVSLTRILGHDAPVALFMTLSLLLLLLAFGQAGEQGGGGAGEQGSPSTTLRTSRGAGEQGSRGAGVLALEDSPPHPRTSAPPLPSASLLVLSGVAAGLAFLSKAPALFLIPFAGVLFLSKIWRNPAIFWTWLQPLAVWGLVAYLTFVIVWPAAWLEPLGRPAAVVENAFLSATDQEEADEEGFWLVPDLGPFYYVVNGGFKLSPLVMIGSGLALFFLFQQTRITKTNHQPANPPTLQPSNLPTFLLFALLFTLFMTLGGKRSPRYILPIFPALSLVAAWGWWNLFQLAAAQFTPAKNNAPRPTPYGSRFTVHVLGRLPGGVTSLTPLFHLTLLLSALLILLPTAPYYFTYYNPLLGGTLTAPRLVKVGWGEGLDQVGRYLQRVVPGSRVGTAYSSTVAPYFKGDLAGLDSDQLDYVVLYIKQVQGGDPPLLPSVVRYYQHHGALFSVNLNGLPYAEIYPGPAVQLTEPHLGPLGFRATTPYGRLGEPLTVDLLWPPSAGPTAPVSLRLVPPDGTTAGLTAAALPDSLNPELLFSRHQFVLPADWPRGRYQLRLEDQPLGELDLRHFEVPARLSQPEGLIFGEQIALAGYNFQLTEDYIRVSLAWRAEQAHLPDYTVFVQLLNAETNERLAGFDSPPQKGNWPTSRWVAGEVVADEVLVAVPPDLQPGFLKLIVGLYRPDTGQRLTLPDGQDHWAIPWTVVRK